MSTSQKRQDLSEIQGDLKSCQVVVGIDEAGRGPLAGPVVAAAVVFHSGLHIDGLADSKAISALRRERLVPVIKYHAIAWALGSCSVEEIDRLNIFQASLLAMQRAYALLRVEADMALVDGQHAPELPVRTRAVIKGDALIPVISAASIVAKVERDLQMQVLHHKYPEYGFDRHKGYPTQAHIAALNQYGPSVHHRRSFRPVRQAARRLDGTR